MAVSIPWQMPTLLQSLPLWSHCLLLCQQSLSASPVSMLVIALGPTQITQCYLILRRNIVTYANIPFQKKKKKKVTFTDSRDWNVNINCWTIFLAFHTLEWSPAIPINREWYLGANMWMLGMLIATWVHSVHQQPRNYTDRKTDSMYVCTYVYTYVSKCISIYRHT